KNVPKNKKTIIEIDRKLIPINRTHKPNINARSLVNLLSNLGEIGEINIKAIKGKLVNKAIFQFANPTSSRIVPISGPIEVIAGRKLKPIIITPPRSKFGYLFDLFSVITISFPIKFILLSSTSIIIYIDFYFILDEKRD